MVSGVESNLANDVLISPFIGFSSSSYIAGIDVSISDFVGNSMPIAALDNCGDSIILHVATNADDMICLRRDTEYEESCVVVDWRDDTLVSLRRGIIDNADTTSYSADMKNTTSTGRVLHMISMSILSYIDSSR